MNLGDWAKLTAHLTPIEEAFLFRLVRLCADSEKALSTDHATLYRLVRATSRADRAAVDAMLKEQFTLAEAGYTNADIDAQLTRYREKNSKARASAEARWRGKSHGVGSMHSHSRTDASAMRTHSERNADAMLTVNRKPKTVNRKPKKETTSHVDAGAMELPGFVMFWDRYPATRRKIGREQCLDLWRTNDLEQLKDLVLNSLAEDVACDEWLAKDGLYIPKPLTWLSERRYERTSQPSKTPQSCVVCGAVAGYKWDGKDLCQEHFRSYKDDDDDDYR